MISVWYAFVPRSTWSQHAASTSEMPRAKVFHEIGHVLLHGKTDLWIEDGISSKGNSKEIEADRFSSNLLIPSSATPDLRKLKSKSAVVDFARRMGIAPGIVVGRLQYDDIWLPSNGNGLKRKLDLARVEPIIS